MKKWNFVIMFAFIFSCNTKKTEEKTITDTTNIATTPTYAGSTSTDMHYFWTSELDPKKGLVMIKTKPIEANSLTATHIIEMLNETYPDVQIRFNKISGDSIFVSILNEKYLTNQMGSSGAEAYLAEATYNLTELNGISYVSFQFKEGQHAAPGVFSRTDFVPLR